MTTRPGISGAFRARFALSAALAVLAAPLSYADTPNAAFGVDGWIRQSTYEGPVQTLGSAVALQADGKLVTAGYRGEILDELFVSRYNTDGTLDTTFDNDGTAIVHLPGTGRPKAVKIQSDQKIVVAGRSRLADNNIAVVRLNTDGTPDNTFGMDGVVTDDLGGQENIEDMVVQPDGKILVVGRLSSTQTFESEALLVRYNADGSRDSSFGTDGVVLSAGEAAAVALQADNKIVAGGSVEVGDILLVMRFNTDGSLDTTFDADGDSDGIVEVSFGAGAFPQLADIAIQADQRIVTTGYSGGEGGFTTNLLRLESDGSIDTTFDEGTTVNGYVDFEIPNSQAFVNSIAIRSNGKVVIGGSSDFQGDMSNPPAEEVFVAQFNTSGTLDTAFDSDGIAVVDVSIDERENISDIVIDTSDRIVTVGSAGSVANNDDMAVLRFTSSGALDNAFSGDGIVLANLPGPFESVFSKVVVQNDCKILAGGYTSTEDNSVLSLVRYNFDGSLDTTFGGSGIVLHEISTYGATVYGLAVQTDGKILIADAVRGPNDASEAAILRLYVDGSIDPTFGTNGTSLTTLDVDGEDIWYDVLVLPNGKILATGVADLHSTRDLAVARFNSDGSIDTSFGVNGVYRTNTLDYGRGLALAPGGKYLVAGADGSSDEIISVLRLNEDGTLDTSFGGGDGRASSSLESSGGNLSNPMTVQADGKVLITGTIFVGGPSLDLAVARFTADGLPDSTFDGDGLVSSDFGSYQQGREIRVQDDGKIIVAGFHNNTMVGTEQFMTVRYNADGSLDTGYGTGGLASFDYEGNESRPYGMAFGNGHVYLAGFTDRDFGALLDLEVADAQSGCQSTTFASIATLADINSNGSGEIVVAMPGSTRAHIRDGATGALLSNINFGDDPMTAMAVIDDISGNGKPEIAMLGTRPDGNVRVQVKDSDTGAAVNNIFYGIAYSAVDMTVLPDTDGNGADELAVLGANLSGGIRIQARDALSDAATSTTYYGDNATPIEVLALPDLSTNAEPEIVMHGRVNSSGQVRAQVRDSATRALLQNIYFGSAYLPIQLAVIGDVSGDGIPDLAQLGRRDDTGAVRIQVKQSDTGAILANAFTGSVDAPIAIVGIDDINGNSAPDLALLVRRPNGTAKIIIRDGATGDFIRNMFAAAVSNPVGMTLVEDLNSNGSPELAVLGDDNAGTRRVQIRDSATGLQVNTIDFP